MPNRHAFTLIELVVVVLVIGILAAVATPRMSDLTRDAKDSSLRQSLETLRDAIEFYRFHNKAYPGGAGTEASLKADLKAYLRAFPKNPIKDSDVVSVQTSGVAITGTITGGAGWIYDNRSGQIVANSNGTAGDGSRYFQW